MDVTFYAVPGKLEVVEAAVRRAFDDVLGGAKLVVRETADSSIEQVYRNEDGVGVVFWQDGTHTCWAESELALVEEEQLAALSAEFGMLFMGWIGDHGGSYGFGLYRDGVCVRTAHNETHAFNTPCTGAPIPEEAGINIAKMGDLDVVQIWERFGLGDPLEGKAPFRAWIPDESALAPRVPESAPSEKLATSPDLYALPLDGPSPDAIVLPAKPWWKFW
jgi:hypothetical protein